MCLEGKANYLALEEVEGREEEGDEAGREEEIDCLTCGLNGLTAGLDCLTCGRDSLTCGLDCLTCGRDCLKCTLPSRRLREAKKKPMKPGAKRNWSQNTRFAVTADRESSLLTTYWSESTLSS